MPTYSQRDVALLCAIEEHPDQTPYWGIDLSDLEVKFINALEELTLPELETYMQYRHTKTFGLALIPLKDS